VILVALLTVPIITLAALAIDAGWWQVGANQLQTTADASALAAARALMLYRGQANVQATAESYATTTADANKAFSQAVSVTGADVEPMWWNPSTRALTASNWTDANSVRVTARATPGLVLAGTNRALAPTIGRQGVAWIANINNGTCVKPWALPYTVLYDKVQALTSFPATASTVSPRPDLDARSMPTLTAGIDAGTITESMRIVIFRPPTYDGAGGNPDSTAALGNLGYNNGMFSGYNFLSPSGNNNASTTTFQANTFGCSYQTVSVNTVNGATLPGSNDIPCAMVNAMMGSDENQCQPSNVSQWTNPESTDWPSGNNRPRINQPVTCYYRPSVLNTTTGIRNWDAGCYASATATQVGSMQTVAWGDNVYNGSNATDFREIGRLKVVCVFRGISAAFGAPANNVEGCQIPGGTLVATYPQGTVVGVIQGLSSPVISPTTELGNIISDQQRLILVK
jgi:hypothetical protein